MFQVQPEVLVPVLASDHCSKEKTRRGCDMGGIYFPSSQCYLSVYQVQIASARLARTADEAGHTHTHTHPKLGYARSESGHFFERGSVT